MAHAGRFALLAAACAVGPARAGDGGAMFEAKVRPVLADHCLRCHGPDKQKGGLRLDSRAAALAGGESGPAVVPGKPDDSPLVVAVRYHDDDLRMPPAGKLADADITALAEWVAAGAPWPAAAEAAADRTNTPAGRHNVRAPGRITDQDRAWWAFQPPGRPAVPATGSPADNPVDAFVLARLEKEGLAPAPEADRRTLIRRLTFDLTGLPPPPGEVEAFADDPSPGAYDRLVDRLLASPRYGERAARPWLDLVRYAESDGYRTDGYRPAAWRYRDYVVRAFSQDKPYDRFVREQLAGDELFPGDPDAAVATGYLTLWSYEYNQRDVRTQWDAILTDLTDNAADTFLGLGMGCARCHDHKFDPILQKDYYALRAFFAGVSFATEPVFPSAAAEAAYAAELAAWEAATADVRAEIDALLAPTRETEMAAAVRRFPPDIEAIFRKPAADRTPGERQLYELAYRQVQLEYDRAPTRLPKGKRAEYDALMKRLAAQSAAAPQPADPRAMVARDLGPTAADTAIPGGRKAAAAVDPGFPTVLGGVPDIRPTAASTGRRAALARWLTRPDHPLTARVLVNRVWQQHFGTGLVATPSDFGTLGDKPSHPDLLDWLAVDFVENGWSVKHLHRRIVTSATYRQSSAAPSAAAATDPADRLLARYPIRRLDAEQVRDAMLAVSGELAHRDGGPARPASDPCRSVYTRAARNSPDPLLAAFDAADGLSGCGRRNVTVTPTQALLLLNGPQALARAEAFARAVMPATGSHAPSGVDRAFRRAFGRPPTAAERADAMAFLRQQVFAGGKDNPVTPEARRAAWTDFCHVLLNSNEFVYVD